MPCLCVLVYVSQKQGSFALCRCGVLPNAVQAIIKPFQLAREIAAASDLPSHSYGIVIMPRTIGSQPGMLVAAVWSTSDSEQLDEAELPGDPIRYSHTCHQYIGTSLQRSQQALQVTSVRRASHDTSKAQASVNSRFRSNVV